MTAAPSGVVATDAPARRVLVVASLYRLPYRVMQCCHALGLEVHVLGAAHSARLAQSHYCAAFHPARTEIDSRRSEALADEINELTERLGLDMVLPGDAPATRTLIATRDRIRTRCFPMPDLEQFDLLHDKWRFGDLCRSLGVKHPQTWLVERKEDLLGQIEASGAAYPLIAKPQNMDGSNGVLVLQPATVEQQIASIDYAPIILQQFIAGDDIGASVYCRGGKIVAFVAHHFDEQVYTTFFDEDSLREIEKIASALKLDGVYNFDMRRAPDGGIWFLECNPRFYFKMAMTLANGMNFVSYGLPGAPEIAGMEVCKAGKTRFRLPNKGRFLKGCAQPWKFELISLKALGYMLADPIPFWRDYYYLDLDPPVEVHQDAPGNHSLVACA